MPLIAPIGLDALPLSAAAGTRFLYVIGEVGAARPVKIGRARHPRWRLQDLQAGNHRQLELRGVWEVKRGLAPRIEEHLHTALIANRLRGEWFDASSDLVISILKAFGEANG